MKKFARIAIAALLILATVIPASAAITPQTIKAGQSTWDINEVAKAPALDGKVDAGEYPTTRRWKVGDANTVSSLKNNATYGYVDVNIGYDADYLYIGAVVQEDTFAVKKASGNYSAFVFHLGCNMKDDLLSSQQYIEATLAINENGSEFGGISVIKYDETGKQSKSWDYMKKLNSKMKYSRGTDADGKAITTYEIHIPFAVMKEAYGLDKIDSKAWFNFSVNHRGDDGTNNGSFGWYNQLTNEQQADIMIEYNWSPKSLYNFIAFAGPKAVETTAAPVTTAAPTTTAAPAVTTAAPAQTPATADNGVMLVAAMMLASVAVLALRRRENH